MPNRSRSFLYLLAALFILQACKSTQSNIERGTPYTFTVGYPEIRFSASGVITDADETIISTSTEIVQNSLIFRNYSGTIAAEILLEIRVLNANGSAISNYTDVVRVSRAQIDSLLDKNMKIDHVFRVDPGAYKVTVSVTDNSSLKTTSLVTSTFLPDPAQPNLNLTPVLLLAKDTDVGEADERYSPVYTYDVAGRMDSLRFEFQVTNNSSREPLTISAKLIQFETDTTPARSMSDNIFRSNSLPDEGIDYRKQLVIISSRRQLLQAGSVYIEFTYPMIERGNYRFEVTLSKPGEDDIVKGRDFSVKSDYYPNLRTVHELAAPLIYLMSGDEYEELMAISDPVKMKQTIDRFWITNIKNPNIAAQVVELYYERVENANKLFASLKEGWKTDMGMMYILFGHPWYVEEFNRRVLWSYSYDRNDPRTNFYFYSPKIKSKYYPFEYYKLIRTPDYFNLNYNQVQLWLSGAILQRNL
jgi:GWxTD domain-containing protein